MHAPGKELDLVTPETFRKCLFGDAIDPEQFRQDHTRFTDALRSEGVKVVLITELLQDQSGLLKETERLPNLVYTRDTATMTPSGYILTRMKNSVRKGESGVVEAALSKLSIPPLMKVKPPATMEGGDLIFLDGETLLVGVGNRTNPRAIQQLMRVGEGSGELRSLLAIPLPSWVLHLDGTMMPVDSDLAIIHLPALQKPGTLFETGGSKKKVNLLKLLREREINLVEVTDYERQRKATNVIPLGARKAIAYNGNARVKRELVKNGVDLIEIESSELIRGSGGPRCMTTAILRE
jgi:N-dimethylarginine dimethylaminohydrolase